MLLVRALLYAVVVLVQKIVKSLAVPYNYLIQLVVMEISLISDTGIQLYTVPEEVTLDLSAPVIRPLRFSEYRIGETTYLDWVTYFPTQDKYVRRGDLQYGGYIAPTGETADEDDINFALLNCLKQEDVMSVGRLNQIIGDRRVSGLEQLEGHWIPVPMFENDMTGQLVEPANWARMLLRPVEEKCTAQKRVYRLVLAFDTRVVADETGMERESPRFDGQALKHYSLCGISRKDLEGLGRVRQAQKENVDVPLSLYRYCDMEARPWLNAMLQQLLGSTDLDSLPRGASMKYLVYYIYFVSVMHKLGAIPDVKLYNAAEQVPVRTNLVLDIGNSRTFGLIAEDPLDASFSRCKVLALRDLGTGEVYGEPFDMRLCFKEERFGLETGSRQFHWPSILRLGREAMRHIYGSDRDLHDSEQYDTNHSSPKRYLWDTDPYEGQWKFITEKERVAGPSHSVYVEGLMQQFRSDGSFTPDPAEMGARAAYSRSSLMTFCFIEILLQARMQANSYEWRHHAGSEQRPRLISRIIVTAPTAMTAREQLVLRRCMEEAAVALRRYDVGTYEIPYSPDEDYEKVEIVPSVRDMKMSVEDLDLRRAWNYDEATCCQMVYLYSELRRYMGNTRQFFSLYGKRLNNEASPSLTVASLDIGAGTSDLMICTYRDEGEAIMPTPLFWESFHTAGDDLVKRIITDVILEGPKEAYPGASGIITARLRDEGVANVAEILHGFFGETGSMGVVERRMRKEFNVQVLIPLACHLLDMLHRGEPARTVTWDEVFGGTTRPGRDLTDFFAQKAGFRFEDLEIGYNPAYLNEIVRRVFEISLRKWAAIFYTYKCDIVLLGGRPSSLKEIQRMMQRLMPVTPNRLISMNDYRVGSWYPGATDIGHFSDKKGLVAVGALIAWLAEQGKLPMFKLNAEALKRSIKPTSEYMGIINTMTGTMQNIVTPEVNTASIGISGFPVYIGCRQLDVEGYPARVLYRLDFDEAALRAAAEAQVARQTGAAPGTPGELLPRDKVAAAAETIRLRTRSHVPLRFTLERDYYTDKEGLRIVDVTDAEGNAVNDNFFQLKLQSRTMGEAEWLDTGVFVLHLGI